MIALAVAVLLYNMVPRGALLGPVILAAAGLAIVTTTRGWWSSRQLWMFVGFALAVLGAMVATRRAVGTHDLSPIQRLFGFLLSRHVIYDLDAEAPERLDVAAVLCKVVIDLRSAVAPRTGPLEIVASSVGGRIELALPQHWPVVAGRLAASRRVRLDGFVDHADAFDDPRSPEQSQLLQDLEGEWQERAASDDPATSVVVHVAGVGGSVRVRGR
ncbi:hypothetical protein Abr02nite_45030 [Paractinoplanes brasiliensis]|nr:hypothetical protein Abr02nite_45030 [Actinoplanes brasiliensis]